MAEHIQDRVSMEKRLEELHQLTRRPSITRLLAYIANLTEQAYIAGASEKSNHLQDTGPTLVRARNFVKDKGLRI